MSIEEKAKAYDEALKRARNAYQNIKPENTAVKAMLEEAFPELRESEDERIRKKLLECCTSPTFEIQTGIKNEVLKDWLEKQKEEEGYEAIPIESTLEYKAGKHAGFLEGLNEGRKQKESLRDFIDNFPYSDEQKEQKPAECIEDSVKFEEGFKAGRESGLRDGQKYVLNNLDSYGLCKPAEWSEDYREEDIQTRFAFYTYKDDSSVLYLSNVFVEESSRNHGFGTRILKAAEKAAEAIGAITICLKVKQDSPANAWYRKRGYGYVAFEDGYDWLEKNLEYMKPNHNTLPIDQQMEAAMIAIRGEMPSKSQEWSEKDENTIQDCIRYLSGQVVPLDIFSKERTERNLAERLKSLRPSWKPSDHQMNILKAVKEYVGRGSGYWGEGLGSLIEDLEKLM